MAEKHCLGITINFLFRKIKPAPDYEVPASEPLGDDQQPYCSTDRILWHQPPP